MALFHLIFELIKISLLSCVYATIVLLIFRVISRYKPHSWFAKVSIKKRKFWFRCGFIISISLFLYMLSYFGDHGLGDQAKIPIGHFKTIEQIDGTYTYIDDVEEMGSLSISKFIISDDFVYGFQDTSSENSNGTHFVYDLKNNTAKTFQAEKEYSAFLKMQKLDKRQYKDFNQYYNQYWNGWRFILLP